MAIRASASVRPYPSSVGYRLRSFQPIRANVPMTPSISLRSVPFPSGYVSPRTRRANRLNFTGFVTVAMRELSMVGTKFPKLASVKAWLA